MIGPASRGLQNSLRSFPTSGLLPKSIRPFASIAQRNPRNSKYPSYHLYPFSASRNVRGLSTVPSANVVAASRTFSSSLSKDDKNRIYTSVRRPDELQSYILASTSSRTPLITLWTASYSPTCKYIAPLVTSLVANGVGESANTSVQYCEVEFDSQDIMESGLGLQYMITSLPTLVTFDRGEMMMDTKAVDPALMRNEAWLTEWIENESKRKGEGTGGGVDGGLFGGLFGNTKQ